MTSIRRSRCSCSAAAAGSKISSMWRLHAWARAQKADVVHVHLRSSLTLVLALRAFGGLRIPIVFHDHYGTIEEDKRTPRWFRVGHRLVGHYVGVSDDLRDWARTAGMPVAKTSTIANALDLSPPRQHVRPTCAASSASPPPRGSRRGRDDPAREGIELALEAIAHLRIATRCTSSSSDLMGTLRTPRSAGACGLRTGSSKRSRSSAAAPTSPGSCVVRTSRCCRHTPSPDRSC